MKTKFFIFSETLHSQPAVTTSLAQTPWLEIYVIFFGYWEESKYVQILSVTHLPFFSGILIPFHFSCHHCDIGSCHFLFRLLQPLPIDMLSIFISQIKLHTIHCRNKDPQTSIQSLYHLVQNHSMTSPASCKLFHIAWSLEAL